MSLQQHIHAQCLASLAGQREAVEQLAEPIARAAELLVDSLMHEGKILVCGQGAATADARLFASLLVNQYKQARPGLAALALDTGARALADDADPGTAYARQIESLGHPGDALLVISATGNAPAGLAALRAAHDKSMRVVALAAGEGGRLAEALKEDDVVICATTRSEADIREVHLRAIHALCDGIDYLLLGA